VVLKHVGRVAPERRRAHEHLVDDRAERIDVAAHVEVDAPLALLRRHVLGRPRWRLGGRRLDACDSRTHHARQPEVEQLGAERRIDKHVLGLEIAVHEIAGVSRLDDGKDGERVPLDLFDIHRPR
jgi:hypothetical protein